MKQHGIDAVRDTVFGKIKHEGLFVSLSEMMSNVTTPQWLIKGILERGSNNLLLANQVLASHYLLWTGHFVERLVKIGMVTR